jgi:hypothetical protein
MDKDNKAGDSEQPKKYNRDTNIIKVSLNRNFSFYVFLAKKFFEDFEEVELHSLGNTCQIAVQVAENLIRHDYATLNKIMTDTIKFEGEAQNLYSKAKLTITLKKGENFDQAIADFEKVRVER